MNFHPLVMALYVSSALIGFMVLYAVYFGAQIMSKWDLRSGSELQLALERKTYLISSLLAYGFGAQLLSLFLFAFTADQLHPFFVGAMCAAGTLYVNTYGYPALILKVVNFLLAGLWLLVNYADNRGYDYPLIRKKYSFLLIIAPLIVLEAILQANYFLRLRPDIITSCCGTLFSIGEKNLVSEMVSLPGSPMKVVFYGSTAMTLAAGVFFYRQGRGGYFFSLMSAGTFVISILSILSFISLYFYELPTHHCPFCILQGEYGYVGYPLYISLFGSGITGMGVGVLMPFRRVQSLAGIIPPFQKRLTLVSLALLMIFMGIVTYRMVSTDFVLGG
jgi:hypothetical protein